MPVTVTAWACCWVGSSKVEVAALPPAGFYDLDARAEFLRPLFERIDEADVLTGHNLLRYDLPVLQSQAMLLKLPKLGPKLVQDTIRLGKMKGGKKGLDNLMHTFGVRAEKLPLNWAQWQAAYNEPDLATVKERVVTDVTGHLLLRDAMRQNGWMESPRMWNP